eukprot:Em0004g635a
MSLLQSLLSYVSCLQSTTAAALVFVGLLFVYRWIGKANKQSGSEKCPPHIPSTLPFLGCAVEFGKNPIAFLLNARRQYGDIFSFTMVGKTFTYLLGPESVQLFFDSKNEDLNAEEVYSKLITPVFGKGVAYDAPNKIFMEQKKLLKAGLSIAHFKRYIPLIEKETQEYFERWGDSGRRDLFEACLNSSIMTASRCLHGREIRERLDERVAGLYADLDGGLSHLAWLLPGWLPLPSFRKRDRAREEMYRIFNEILQKRRETPSESDEDDMLNTLLQASYKDGRPVSNNEIIGMLIGFLLAGQHTSSTTSAWLGFFLARDKKLQDKAFAEQVDVCGGGETTPVNYEQVKDMTLLELCLKETLRLRPPIMTMMRMVKTQQEVKGYTIPPGHQVCVSPTVNHLLEECWTDPDSFNPERFVGDDSSTEKFSYVPFGAGRHRCVGESFAYIQIKTIWSVLLRKYEFDLVDGYFPPINYSTMIHTPTKPIINYKKRMVK